VFCTLCVWFSSVTSLSAHWDILCSICKSVLWQVTCCKFEWLRDSWSWMRYCALSPASNWSDCFSSRMVVSASHPQIHRPDISTHARNFHLSKPDAILPDLLFSFSANVGNPYSDLATSKTLQPTSVLLLLIHLRLLSLHRWNQTQTSHFLLLFLASNVIP
jgi:hypothetical protein